jgi:hypothetical protein
MEKLMNNIIYDLPEYWDTRARATVELAAHVVGTRLAQYTGLDAAASFEAVYGEQHVRYNGAIKYWAYSTGNKVIFRRGYVLLPLLIHEWGHTFDRLAELKPSQDIGRVINLAIKARLWPGMHPMGWPDYDANEQFANLFADYCLQMIAQNIYGRELAAWMDAHMAEWCAVAMGGGR